MGRKGRLFHILKSCIFSTKYPIHFVLTVCYIAKLRLALKLAFPGKKNAFQI